MELADVTDSKSVGLITRAGSTPAAGTTSEERSSIPFPRFPKEPRKLHIRARLFPFPFKAKCFEGSGVESRANPVFLSKSKQNVLIWLEVYYLKMRS